MHDLFRSFSILFILLMLEGCRSGPPEKVAQKEGPTLGANVPVVELRISSQFIKGEHYILIYSSGEKIMSTYGKIKHVSQDPRVLNEVMSTVEKMGFFTLKQSELEEEVESAEAESKAMRLIVQDGSTKTLTVCSGSKSNTISWPWPEQYAARYPTLTNLHKYNDCLRVVVTNLWVPFP